MNESLFEKLVEISWRRRLTPDEEIELQAWLGAHPEDAERWEAEAGVNQALEHLEPVAPSSNFTRRVLDLVELDRRATAREETWGAKVRRALRVPKVRLAWGLMAILVAAGIGYYQHQEHSLEQVASGVRSFSTVAASTTPEVLQDFEIILEFSQVRPETDQTDEALFTLLGGD